LPSSPTTATQWVLKDKQKQLIGEFKKRVRSLMEKTPPDGKSFTHAIFQILQREKNWIHWKRDGCKAFEKTPAPTPTPTPTPTTPLYQAATSTEIDQQNSPVSGNTSSEAIITTKLNDLKRKATESGGLNNKKIKEI